MLKRSALALAAVAAVAASGCAEEREPITYVQNDVLDKSFFIGKDFVATSDDPEFWSQATLVDVGYGAAQDGLFTSTYAQPMSRMKWIVTQDKLIARATYERINDSDGKGDGVDSDDGVIVAVFPIRSHFDIQKQYNPATGEEINVVVENTTDRPWNERQFMRVDWSKNENTDSYDFDTLSLLGIYGGIHYQPLSYYINDPAHPDAPKFDTKDGYFDVTTKAFATPKEVDLSHLGWGIESFPACFLPADFSGGGGPSASCNPVELTIRHSFRRVVDTDYEPIDWDGHRFQSYGAFTVERMGFARNYGMTDTQWHRFIARYNIWERSHYYDDPAEMTGAVECYVSVDEGDPNRDEDGNGTSDSCEAVTEKLNGLGGSRCDTFKQKCTLPYRAREVRPLAWYYSNGSDTRYFDGTEWATHEWDVALRSAVITARYSECIATGGEVEACKAEFPVYSGQQDDNLDAVALAREVDACRLGRAYEGQDCDQVAARIIEDRKYNPEILATATFDEMVVLCHSPVEAGDPAACGDARLPADMTAIQCADARAAKDEAKIAICDKALNVRRGDLRYHQVNAIPEPQTPSPWGIMTDSEDPVTGEKVAASINVWTYINDLWSQGIVDTARYIAGELETEDVTEGTYIEEWAKLAEAASKGGALGTMTAAEYDKSIAAVANVPVEKLRELRASGLKEDPRFIESALKLDSKMRNIRAKVGESSVFRATYEARRNRALGTEVEAQLITKQMLQFAGADELPAQIAGELASPLRGANPTVMRELAEMKEVALAKRGACILNEAPAPLAMTGLTELLQAKFGSFNKDDSKADQLARAEKMRAFLAQRAQYNVIAHEMGHSIGLRHNFVSSADAWNFRPQYWQLRTDDGTKTAICQDLDPTGACVGPRYFDPVTENERTNLIQMFMQSTVMDYAGESTQDLLGLGAYDFAATRFFYGDVVSVYTDPSYAVGRPRGVGALYKLDNFGGITGIRTAIGNARGTTVQGFMHYSMIQNSFQAIQACETVDPEKFKPALYNEERDGVWHPLVDGMIVTNESGQYTRCRQQPVDYVQWSQMRKPIGGQDIAANWINDPSPSIDPNGRIRVPYGFGTDSWADTGNLSVFRHDNGADPYELFDFLITQQEVNHIFDMYRRGRTTFSVRGAATRNLGRFNTKLRDAAKGLGLYANIYREYSYQDGWDFNTFWPVLTDYFGDNTMAAKLAFDHFTRMLARPEPGEHILPIRNDANDQVPTFPEEDGVLRSREDFFGTDSAPTAVVIPNGATGKFGNVSFGGKPIENRLAEDKGEYRSEYTISAGAYYDKAYTAMLMTESADNFISASRGDFVDARYRAVSLADLFPDAYRRWLATNLTGDDQMKGIRIVGQLTAEAPFVDVEQNDEGYPAFGTGWTTWLPDEGPQVCFPNQSTIECSPTTQGTVAVDPQIGWEQQKFLIAFTLMYLPENQKQTWLNQLWLWELGADSDPGFTNRIEFHDPFGRIYIAKTFGKETLFGKTVQKAPAARILEYANMLLEKGFVTTPGDDLDGDGSPDWYEPVMQNGVPLVKYDPTVRSYGDVDPTCSETDNSGCTCEDNRACMQLQKYNEVPYFLREAVGAYGLGHPSMKGLY